MKKILAVLVVLAMALSVSTAFAGTNSYLVLSGTAKPDSMSTLQVNFGTPMAAGDVVSIDFRPCSTAAADWKGLSVRSYNHAAKWLTVTPTYDGETFTGYEVSAESGAAGVIVTDSWSVTAGENGWYTLSFTAETAVADGFWIRFYFADDHFVTAGEDSIVDIDNLKVGSAVCTFDAADVTAPNTVTVKLGDSDVVFDKKSQMDWQGSLATEEVAGAPEETTEGVEETTGGVEETGVVSIAVAAVVAVLGGAVVLKKREF